jgi:hypothetical protein
VNFIAQSFAWPFRGRWQARWAIGMLPHSTARFAASGRPRDLFDFATTIRSVRQDFATWNVAIAAIVTAWALGLACVALFCVGVVPGWAYLGPLPDELVLPRRSVPRTEVPAGSVAIAGRQTGVYPLAVPGGWHLIGRTSVKLFLPNSHPPCLFRAGDRVKFFAARP